MAIKSKFIIFDTISNFQSSNGINNKTTATNGYYGNVPEGAVVFIKDTGLIWFHGTYFGIDTSLTYATQSWVISQGYTKNTGTVTSIATGAGLTGGTITTSGTIKANLVHETKASFATSETPSNRVTGKSYPVSLDSNGKLMVYVPWTDNNTTSFTITANATDGLWDITGTNGTNAVTYAVGAYLSQLSKASFDTSSTAPTRSDRLNYNGYLYATKLFSGGVEVLTSHQSLSNYLPLSGGTITGNLTVNGNTTLNKYINIYPYSSSYGSNPVSLYWNDITHTIVGNTKLDGTNNTAVSFLHSGNSSVSKSGETLTVKINGTSLSLTNTNTWNKVSISQDGYVASIGSGNADSYNKLTSSDQPVVLAFRKGVNGVTDAGWFRLPDNAFLNNTYDLSNYLPLSGGTLNNDAVISRTGTSVVWINGRKNPIIKTTSYTGYNAILSMKTTNGSWDLGVYSNDRAYLTYIADTNYSAGNNTTTYLLLFPNKNGTIATTSDLSSYLPLTGGTLTGNLEISASDWKTFKITRSNVGWSQFGIDANGLYMYEYDNSNSLANYMYLKGGLGLTLTGHFLPNPSATYNLGSSSLKWNNLYLSNVLSDGTNSLTVANIKSTYDWYQTMTTGNTDGTINKWKEIESFVNGISDTSTLNGILAGKSNMYSYTIGGGKTVRITYDSYQLVIISVSGSNQGGLLVLIGSGYGEEGAVRNRFTEVVSCSTSTFTWSLPASSSISRSIEIHSNRTNNSTITVISTGSITFTEISALTTAALNAPLATQNWVTSQGYITSHQSLSSYFHYLGANLDLNQYADGNNNNGIIYINTSTPSNINSLFNYGSVLNFSANADSWLIAHKHTGILMMRTRWWSQNNNDWGDWQTIITSDNISSYTYSKTDSDSRYLKKNSSSSASGDTGWGLYNFRKDISSAATSNNEANSPENLQHSAQLRVMNASNVWCTTIGVRDGIGWIDCVGSGLGYGDLYIKPTLSGSAIIGNYNGQKATFGKNNLTEKFIVFGNERIVGNSTITGTLSVTEAATFNNNVTIKGSLIDLPGLGEGFKIHSDNNYFGSALDGVLFTIKDGNLASGVDGGIVFRSEATNNGTVTATDWLIMRYAGSNYGTFTWLGKNILHAGNTYISNGVITINGTNITPLTSLPARLQTYSLNTSDHRNADTTCLENGFYWCNAGTLPANVSDIDIITVNANSNYGHQLGFKFSGAGTSGTAYDGKDLYTRIYKNGTWQPWYTIITSGNWMYNITYPAGFTSRGTSDWSGVAGTLATDWSVNGADIMFKYDGSKLNVITDGRFYLGIDIYGSSKRVLDEYDILHTSWGNSDTIDGFHAYDNLLFHTFKQLTMSTVNTIWYLKIVLSGYAQPDHIYVNCSYNNEVDRAHIYFSGMSLGYIYRNNNQNQGNIKAIALKAVYDSTEKLWIFYLKFDPIYNSSSLHYSPSSSATVSVYTLNNDKFNISIETTEPSGVSWITTGTEKTNLLLKNATLYGHATDDALADHNHDNIYLRKDTNDSTAYQYSFTKTNDHAIQVGTIRGRAVGNLTGEYLHIYNRVHIGSPSGWGSRDAPNYGLSTYGSAWLATDTGNVGIGTTTPITKLEVNGSITVKSDGRIYFKYVDNDSTQHTCIGRGTARGNPYNDTLYGDLEYYAGSWTSKTDLTAHLFRTLGSNSALVIKNNGSVGIGKISPAYKLDVDGVTRSTAFLINGANGAIISGRDTISATGEKEDLWIYQGKNTLRTVIYDARYIHLYSKVRIGTNYATTTTPEYALEVSGSVSATDFTATSDIRLKRDIQQISDHIYSFRFKDSDKLHYGFIALELEKNYPDLVGEGEYKTVNYNSALSLYVAELENRVKMLENEINNLKNK